MNKTTDIFAEAKALNVTLEQENGGWVAYLPTSGNEEDIGFPAPTEEEALDEVRAHQAIEQSSLYKFEYNEQRDVYSVTFGAGSYEDKLLATAYREAQKAYAASIATPPPEPEPAAPTAPPKARKTRTPKTLPGVPPDAPEAVKAAAKEEGPPWDVLPEAPTKAASGLAFIADLLDDIAEVLRKRGGPHQ